MCKSVMFHKIINVVSEETEISEHDILSKRKTTEIVDARVL